jgi:TPP-dependent pyruvate/acetoin dehydrogenase alpha subunit
MSKANNREQKVGFLRQMMRIRLFEERVLEEFSRGRLFGTAHTCIGQEANAVGVLSAARQSDIVFSNHRGHGHFLAHGGDMHALAAELMGKATGVCGGLGGSQHLHLGTFYSNGVQGGIVPCATGMALAEKLKGSGNIVIAFLGDGTLGQGVVYESLNMASLWGLPVLYVLENNLYAQTTPVAIAVAGDIAARFCAFGIQTRSLQTTNVIDIFQVARELVADVRANLVPWALVLQTYRLSPHSKGDDIRDPAEVERHRRFDPIAVHGESVPEAVCNDIYAECLEEVNRAFRLAESDPLPDPEQLLHMALEALP